jgi:ubiquinone/menaquinone biosynthesis C-methylase UbiE
MVGIELIRSSGWLVGADFLDGLSEYEREFMRIEFTGQRTRSYYGKRIAYHGITGCDAVLDAGCGMGQWSVALAGVNKHVHGIDLNEGRISVGRKLVDNLDVRNVHLAKGSIESIQFPADAFDAVFCYGVFMFTDMPRSLAEFSRVLRPGGKLYVNANSYGWYVHLLRDVPWNRKPALGIIKNTILQRTRTVIVSEPWLRKILHRAGFRIIDLACEGRSTFHESPPMPKPEPAYQETYWGMRSILEVCAVKR